MSDHSLVVRKPLIRALFVLAALAVAASAQAKDSGPSRTIQWTTLSLGAMSADVPGDWKVVEGPGGLVASRYAVAPGREAAIGLLAFDLPASGDVSSAVDGYIQAIAVRVLRAGRAQPLDAAIVGDTWSNGQRIEGQNASGRPAIVDIRSAESGGKAYLAVTLLPASPSEPVEVVMEHVVASLQSHGPLTVASTAAPASSAAAPAETMLFDGRLDDAWRPLSTAGGDFSRFASTGDGLVVIDVPPGNTWGKTGIRSAERIVTTAGPDGRPALAHLRFGFDPDRTTSFVLALGPNDQMEEWGNHDLRFGWSRSDDGTSGSAALWVRSTEVWRMDTAADAPAFVDMTVAPDGSAVVTLPDGVRMEAVIPAAPPEGYYLYALAHAPAADAAAKMALKSIKLTHQEPPAVAGPLPYPDERPSIVLFDGTLGKTWVRHAAAGGDFARDARLADGRLAVDVAADHGWAKVGILSDGPVVWLERFDNDAEARVTFSFDPEQTTGFALALTSPQWGHVGGNDPSHPSALFLWRQEADAIAAKAEFHINPHSEGDFWSADLAADPPSAVAFVLRPGSVAIEIDGAEVARRDWAIPAEGAGLSVYAYSHPAGPNLPVRMALNEIRLDRTFAETGVKPPAAGVEPLPETVLFGGTSNEIWEPAAVAGGDFTAFAKTENGWLVVDVPEGHGWAKTGLLSTKPVVLLDGRVEITPTRFTFTFDPKRTDGIRIAVASDKNAEMWLTHDAWITLIHDPESGTAIVGLHKSPYEDWYRPIDGDWMRSHWDGRLLVDFGNGWTAVCLAEGACVRGPTNIAPGTGRYMTVLAHAEHEGGPARMALARITERLVTPPGMSEIDRWILVDDAAFDPDAFADALVAAE